MILHYGGKYSGNPDDLPCLEHEPGAVQFKEAKNAAQLTVITTVMSVVIFLVSSAAIWIRARDMFFDKIVLIPYLLTILPHELLHALCYKYDVYLYHDLSHGMLFVIGPERMSKARFIFKCLLPSIVLGWLPILIFMIHPEYRLLGTLGTLGLATAAGDYYNAFNALKQMPKGAWAYLHKYSTFWFMPQQKTAEG